MEVGHIAVEPDTWRVYVDEKAIETTPKEYELLSYLIKNKKCRYDKGQHPGIGMGI